MSMNQLTKRSQQGWCRENNKYFDYVIEELEVTDPTSRDNSENITGGQYALPCSAHMSKPDTIIAIVKSQNLRALDLTAFI